jgi:N-carbamoylputrescine amidase
MAKTRSRAARKARTAAPSDAVRVALIQAKATEDAEENLRRTLVRIAEAARKGAKVVCLQELFRTTYFCQREEIGRFDLAEPIPGPTTRALAAAAKKNKVVVVGSVFEKRAAGLHHNTAVVFDADGREAGLYRKMHIPHDPRFYEKYYFAPGDTGFRAFDTAAGRIGVLVCWDQWFPEGARLTALEGAWILFYPTAIGTWVGERGQEARHREAWTTIQRSHAIANGVYVAAVNRVGREEDLVFWGSSFVSDPFGHVVAKASADREEVLLADCSPREMDDTRRNWPFLRDRRVDAYGPLAARWIGAGR